MSATLNIPMARKVLEHLVAHPEEHTQPDWLLKTPCGTKACVAGTTVLLDAESVIRWSDDGNLASVAWPGGWGLGGQGVEERAVELLGLDSGQVDELFYEMDNADAVSILAGYISQAEATL